MRASEGEREENYLFRSKLLRLLTAPLALAYGAALKLRPAPAPERAGQPVISVGNLHVGGAGKTPLVIALARELAEAGRRVAVVSRGYGGTSSRTGAAVTRQSRAEEVGDEPVEIAAAVPGVTVQIGADRVAAARRAAAAADLLILDDGFQHRRLHRDLDIVVAPAAADPRRSFLLPLGRLREPLSALARAQAMVLVSEPGDQPADVAAWRRWTEARFFAAERVIDLVRPYPGTVEPVALLGRKVVVFSGIARPERFQRAVAAAGGTPVEILAWGDHHPYRPGDLELIRRLTARHGTIAVTTEKDAARLGYRPLPFPAAILKTTVRCEGLARFCLEAIA